MKDLGRLESSITRRMLLGRLALGVGALAVRPGAFAFACSTPKPSAIAKAAIAFAASLGAEQRDAALFAFDDARRDDWHYIPKPRKGVPYKQLDERQRRLADALVESGLGAAGMQKVSTIRSLDLVLAEIEKGSGPTRDPELYYISLFGTPRDDAPWGWSLEGHHVSANFTLLGADRISSTPHFLGANPAEVRHGPRTGLRTLAAEEDAARSLLAALDAERRARAVISTTAPGEILSANSRKAAPADAVGLVAGTLDGRQRDLLAKLLDVYVSSVAPHIASARLAKVRAAGLDSIRFAWAGGLERGQPHYYRIQGPTFLVEYDNTQNDANHVHTVWRDFDADFGRDLLGEHYRKAHT